MNHSLCSYPQYIHSMEWRLMCESHLKSHFHLEIIVISQEVAKETLHLSLSFITAIYYTCNGMIFIYSYVSRKGRWHCVSVLASPERDFMQESQDRTMAEILLRKDRKQSLEEMCRKVKGKTKNVFHRQRRLSWEWEQRPSHVLSGLISHPLLVFFFWH